jgi:hypothetical protein
MNIRHIQLLEQKLKARDFKPLPVVKRADRFPKSKMDRLKDIVAEAVSEFLDEIVYITDPDLNNCLYEAFKEEFSRPLGKKHAMQARAQSYLRRVKAREDIHVMDLDQAVVEALGMQKPCLVRGIGYISKTYYKDKDKFYNLLREHYRIDEIHVQRRSKKSPG